MRSLLEQGVHSIIITSGTLSPLQATISELGIPINVQLENPHIIKSNQVHFIVTFMFTKFKISSEEIDSGLKCC